MILLKCIINTVGKLSCGVSVAGEAGQWDHFLQSLMKCSHGGTALVKVQIQNLPLGAGLGLIEEHLPNTSGSLHSVFNL